MPDTLEPTPANPTAFEHLKDQMHQAALNEQLTSQTPDLIDQRAKALWDWSVSLPEGHAGLRLRVETSCTVLETAGPDRPFLVDSLLNTCAALNIQVQALFHPIVEINPGERRSFIQIVLPPLTQAEREDLSRDAELTLKDVIAATTDYLQMKGRMAASIAELRKSPNVAEAEKAEAVAFLEWLSTDHFVFLGAREYRFHTDDEGNVLPEEPDIVPGSSLGLLRDEARNVLNRGAEPLILSAEIGAFLSEPQPLILAKATLVSRVHRRVASDYIGVKHFGPNGRVIGETRFLGLYTAEAYDDSIRNIPLIRQRVKTVMDAKGASKGTYNEKTLSNILESWPRDELFQTDADTLLSIMEGVLSLAGRPRIRLFLRPDRFDRFVTAIVFVPRESYDTALREAITEELETAFGGRLVQFQPRFDATKMVRVMFEIALPNDVPDYDEAALEQKLIELSTSWNDQFRAALLDKAPSTLDQALATPFCGAFNAAYREAFAANEALLDVVELNHLSADAPVRLRAYRDANDDENTLRAKIYSRAGSIALSDCVPVFEKMGLFVAFETGYPVRPNGPPSTSMADTYWVHALTMSTQAGRPIDLETAGAAFEQAFVAVWQDQAENDGLNALVLEAGLTWREAALCRALCAYRQQSGLDPAKSIQIEALRQYPGLTRQLVDLFHARFDPSITTQIDQRAANCTRLADSIEDGLKTVVSLNHDRVLRRLVHLIQALQRTNYFQTTSSGTPLDFICFKIASQNLRDLPDPKPYREIFVASPQVEGVHCRFGPVARGGLRWSDRRDDFRTEVLGLVKAQQVKNAVIVPVGSKGGFFPKTLPIGGERDAIREAGIGAYKTFITALLSLTDNLIDGKTSAPADTVIWDGEDPYLVVAADKGTATFSDIANEISVSQGFWLGDAFASGGSAGYDHKKMGITARGAWEAVKRHFRTLGTDIQTEPFSVIGCGDMSGDVFGNGMLLSKQTRLLAAFNHLHIFIDPDPADTLASWTERERMFNLPRSSWSDYDESLISEGGGVFERSAKSVSLSPQIQALTGLSCNETTPDELIHALLKTPCDLLWFGGIGTYVKAASESHAEADDRANDGLRVNGKDVGARVIGEGANLGLTQAGRIEFARHGGLINTDAIDNSAGVDSSDHEVNIKILCAEAIRRGSLQSGERNTLLASMTDQVAQKVLAHNYTQTGALSLATQSARHDHDGLERLMVRLETRGVLDRQVEGLPDTTQMAERKAEDIPLTAPEIAILMAWTKIVLFDDLVASDLPDDPHFAATLQTYFPEGLAPYAPAMQSHRLKREIIATIMANRVIDLAGPVHFLRLREQSEARSYQLVSAIETAYQLLGADQLQADINALDNIANAFSQMALQLALANAIGGLTLSLVGTRSEGTIGDRLTALRPVIGTFKTALPHQLQSTEQDRYDALVATLSAEQVPPDLAAAIGKAEFCAQAPQIADLAAELNIEAETGLSAYHRIGEALGLHHLKGNARTAMTQMPYWDRLATRKLLIDMRAFQIDTTKRALSEGEVEAWLTAQSETTGALLDRIDLLVSPKASFAQFALAGEAIRDLMRAQK